MSSQHAEGVFAVVMAARVLSSVELERVIESAETALAVGPILDPTLYRDHAHRLEQDLELLRAALPLWQVARTKLAKEER